MESGFCPNTATFSAVHNISVSYRSRLARSPGGLGGRSRIEFIVSPLPRRRHNESHFAAQSPERAFLAKPFFARAKNGVNSGRRSHKISVGEAKCYICRHKRAGALHLIRRLRRHLPLGGEGKGEIVPRGSTNEGNFGRRQSVNRFDIMLSMVWKAHCFFIRFSISLFVAPISSSAYSPDTASARIL